MPGVGMSEPRDVTETDEYREAMARLIATKTVLDWLLSSPSLERLERIAELAKDDDRVEQVGRWISVNHKLPQLMLPVLTSDGRRVTQTYRTSNDASGWGAWAPNQVTHWQPLPAPPSAEQEAAAKVCKEEK